MVTKLIVHLITLFRPKAIIHYVIFYNSYVIRTINNHVDQNKKYDIVPYSSLSLLLFINT